MALISISCPSDSLCVTGGSQTVSGVSYGFTDRIAISGSPTWSSPFQMSENAPVGSVSCATTSDCVAASSSLLMSTDGGGFLEPPRRLVTEQFRLYQRNLVPANRHFGDVRRSRILLHVGGLSRHRNDLRDDELWRVVDWHDLWI
jgi:hypothetical protein